MKRKLGITCDFSNNNPLYNLEKIKQSGFDCFFSLRYFENEVEEIRKKADSLGLEFEFIHSPYANINEIWSENNENVCIYENMISSIKSASKFGVKKVVLHVSSGWNPPKINDSGLKRYDQIVDLATKLNVAVAFENLRLENYLYTLLQRYNDCSNVGFCYDFGHENCFTQGVSFPDILGNKMICTHIHDNFGKPPNPNDNGDLHLLPFEGNIDFKEKINKLDEAKYKGSLMLEVFNTSPNSTLSDNEFLTTCYQRLTKISSYSK